MTQSTLLQEFEALEQQWADIFVRADAGALDSLLMDDFIYTSARGEVLHKTLARQPHLLRQGVKVLLDCITTGALKITIGGSYPLAEAAAAHHALETRQTTGKLVLTI